MELVPLRNTIRLRRFDQRALRQIKSYIEISKDDLFFVNHMSTGSTHAKWYLVQVDMDQSVPFSMSNYGCIVDDGTLDNIRAATNIPL